MTNEILLSQKVPTEKTFSIAPEDLKNDIDILSFTLENAYGGKKILPGTQYSDLIADLNTLKNKSDNTSSDQLCNQLAVIFDRVSDYHNTIKIENRLCGRSWPKGSVGANSGLNDKNKTWSSFSKSYNNKNIPILSLRNMSPDSSPQWSGFLLKAQELAGSKKSFIIDLRGNGGGSTTNAFELARILYGLDQRQELPWPKKQVSHLQTPESWALTANYYWLTMQQLKSAKQPIPEYIPNAYKKFVQLSQDAKQGLMPIVQIQNLGGGSVDLKSAITSPVYVLIDRGCGSTCELVLEALERLPAVHTIGQRTTGVVQYGFAGWLYLPASHIVVQLSTQGTRYIDGRQVEKIGYSPHWPVSVATDAMEYTLKTFFK